MAAVRAEIFHKRPMMDAVAVDEAVTVFFKPVMNRREAEILFEIDAAQTGESSGWKAYFVENLTEFLVFGERPTGRISETDARWLVSWIGEEYSPSVPELLRTLILQAEDVPQSIIACAMRCGAMKGRSPSLV